MITKFISHTPDAIAPDGSEVRVLAATARGSMAQFTLPVGKISRAVAHQSVDEVWFFLSGHGKIWRKCGSDEEISNIMPGLSLSIAVGTHFQFRNDGSEPLTAIAATMPPWPGEAESYYVSGIWR